MDSMQNLKIKMVTSQVNEIRDGTTGIDGPGTNPMRVSGGRGMVANSCLEKLDRISDTFVNSKMNSAQWTGLGSRQDPSFCSWAPERIRGPDIKNFSNPFI